MLRALIIILLLILFATLSFVIYQWKFNNKVPSMENNQNIKLEVSYQDENELVKVGEVSVLPDGSIIAKYEHSEFYDKLKNAVEEINWSKYLHIESAPPPGSKFGSYSTVVSKDDGTEKVAQAVKETLQRVYGFIVIEK